MGGLSADIWLIALFTDIHIRGVPNNGGCDKRKGPATEKQQVLGA